MNVKTAIAQHDEYNRRLALVKYLLGSSQEIRENISSQSKDVQIPHSITKASNDIDTQLDNLDHTIEEYKKILEVGLKNLENMEFEE